MESPGSGLRGPQEPRSSDADGTRDPQSLSESLDRLLATWREKAKEQRQWADEREALHDGANAHAHLKAARIYRECADDLASLLQVSRKDEDAAMSSYPGDEHFDYDEDRAARAKAANASSLASRSRAEEQDIERELKAAFDAGHYAWPTVEEQTLAQRRDRYVRERLAAIGVGGHPHEGGREDKVEQ